MVSMGIGWDPTDETVIIEAHGESTATMSLDIGDDSDSGPDTLRGEDRPAGRVGILDPRHPGGCCRTSAVPVLPSSDRPGWSHLSQANGYRRHAT